MAELLEVKNLSVTYRSPRGDVQAVRDVSFSLRPGEVLAVVGESGCGKSALCRAVMRLLPDSAAVSGEILVNGVDIAPYREREMQKLRGRLFSMVFQDPLTALNPSMTIGAQIAEAVRVHDRKAPREAVSARVEELMALRKQSPDGVPRCPRCGTIVKPDVVLYEEPLDDGTVTAAVRAIASADLLVIAGTSLAVYPAAGLIDYFSGDHLAIINRTPTPRDAHADLCIATNVGDVLGY